jgi:hypothetical protein
MTMKTRGDNPSVGATLVVAPATLPVFQTGQVVVARNLHQRGGKRMRPVRLADNRFKKIKNNLT